MKLEPNTTVSHYKILSEIGKGGMGEVFLAEDTRLKRKVAIKFLSDEFSRDSDKLNRFIQEAQAASALNHPNIITIHEIDEADGTRYIALEYIEGETLTKRLGEALNFDTALDIAIQIASALDAAHSAGIVHRDIKPDNVMVREDGLVKILDFGIAKLTEKSAPEIESEDKTAVQVNTTPGMIIGTANYMSPEQAKGKEVDSRTDIFSFGVVLYEMVTGRLPFEGGTPMESISAIIKDDPIPLSDTGTPPDLARIILKALRKNPDDRYQTARGLIADLNELKQELAIQEKLGKTIEPNGHDGEETRAFKATTAANADHTTATGANDSITIRKSSFSKGLIGLAMIAVLAAIGLGYWYFSGGSSNQINSIAVMPFVNESGNEDVEYLSDGMTETLISSLSKLQNVQVKPHSSVFRYKGKNTDTKTIGRELNVEAVLNGRVVQRGNQLTLSLELVDVDKEVVLWSERYNRKQSELVSLQSEIAKDVSGKLRSRLSGEDKVKVTSTGTANPDAYQAYLKGRFYWNKRTGDDLNRAIQQFKIASEKDPNYALAYVGLADSYVLMALYAESPRSESLPFAEVFAKRAIDIDGTLGEAHTTLGLVNFELWRWKESEREFKRAIDLSPGYATAYQWYSVFLRSHGRYDEAAAMLVKAREIDPLSRIIGNNVSAILAAQENLDASIEDARRTIELYPNAADSYRILGTNLLKKGQQSEAILNLEKAVELDKQRTRTVASLGYGYAVTGKRAEARAIAKKLERRYENTRQNGIYIGAVYGGLGELDKAFEWVEKDFQARGDVSRIRWELIFEPLRGDPRCADLLKRMGLPE